MISDLIVATRAVPLASPADARGDGMLVVAVTAANDAALSGPVRALRQRDQPNTRSITLPPKSVSFSWRPLCRYQTLCWLSPSACRIVA